VLCASSPPGTPSPVCGWTEVSKVLDYAASRFQDGDMMSVERVAIYRSGATAALSPTSPANVRSRRVSRDPFERRVSTTWRREDGVWRIAHRHADPTRTVDPMRRGSYADAPPLRMSSTPLWSRWRCCIAPASSPRIQATSPSWSMPTAVSSDHPYSWCDTPERTVKRPAARRWRHHPG
jgi:ketosteroid isomerase-like protein